jgi:hypothetical protein
MRYTIRAARPNKRSGYGDGTGQDPLHGILEQAV